MSLGGTTSFAKLKGLTERHTPKNAHDDQAYRELLGRVVEVISGIRADQQERTLDTLIKFSPERGEGSEGKLRALMAQVGVRLPPKPERRSSRGYGSY